MFYFFLFIVAVRSHYLAIKYPYAIKYISSLVVSRTSSCLVMFSVDLLDSNTSKFCESFMMIPRTLVVLSRSSNGAETWIEHTHVGALLPGILWMDCLDTTRSPLGLPPQQWGGDNHRGRSINCGWIQGRQGDSKGDIPPRR